MPALDREVLDAVILRLIELGLVGQEEESSSQNISTVSSASSLDVSSQREPRAEPEARTPEAHSDLEDWGSNVSCVDSDHDTVKICAPCFQTMANNESFAVPLASLSQPAAVVAPPPVAAPVPALVPLAQVTSSGPAPVTPASVAPPASVPTASSVPAAVAPPPLVPAAVAPSPSVLAASVAPLVFGSAAPVHTSPVIAPPDALSNITAAGRIPQCALRFMTAATIDALNALNLDTVPPNPNDGWYTITVGTWIGISDDWSFVSFHVSGVSRAAYRREDSWLDARTRFLRARDQGICRLV